MSEDGARVDAILSALDSTDKDRISRAKDITVERVPTPSLGLTRALGGGWGMGRFALIWGPKSAGKTTFALRQIALLQADGKTCAYFDVESSFDPEWAAALGVDNDQLIIVDSKSTNHMVDNAVKLIQAGVDFITIDSISMLVPAAYLEKDGEELKSLSDMGAMGAHARDMAKAIPALANANKNTLILLVSQQRMKSNGIYWAPGPTGGTTVEHAPTQTVKLNSTSGDMSKIMGSATVGDRVIEKQIGRKVFYTVDKNKLGPEGYSGDYALMFEGDFIGIDTFQEVLRMAVDTGIVDKAGAWYKLDGDIIGQGEASVAKKFREDEELYNKVVSKLGIDT